MTAAVLEHPEAVDITVELNAAAGAETGVAPASVSRDHECVHLLPPDECAICRGRASNRSPRPKGADRHRWTRDDEIVVAGAYLERGTVNLPAAEKEHLADLIGCSVASVALKLGNLDAHLSSGALASGSKLMREIADELASIDPAERRRIVVEARRRLEASPD
jgi:hypothetical protein